MLDCEERNDDDGVCCWGASGRIIDDDKDASLKLLVCATFASSLIVPLRSNVPATLSALPAANAYCMIRIMNKLREGTNNIMLTSLFHMMMT